MLSTIRTAWRTLRPITDEAVRERLDSMVSQAQGQIHHAGCCDPDCEACGLQRRAVTQWLVEAKPAIAAQMRAAHAAMRAALIDAALRWFDRAVLVAVLVLLVLKS